MELGLLGAIASGYSQGAQLRQQMEMQKRQQQMAEQAQADELNRREEARKRQELQDAIQMASALSQSGVTDQNLYGSLFAPWKKSEAVSVPTSSPLMLQSATPQSQLAPQYVDTPSPYTGIFSAIGQKTAEDEKRKIEAEKLQAGYLAAQTGNIVTDNVRLQKESQWKVVQDLTKNWTPQDYMHFVQAGGIYDPDKPEAFMPSLVKVSRSYREPVPQAPVNPYQLFSSSNPPANPFVDQTREVPGFMPEGVKTAEAEAKERAEAIKAHNALVKLSGEGRATQAQLDQSRGNLIAKFSYDPGDYKVTLGAKPAAEIAGIGARTDQTNANIGLIDARTGLTVANTKLIGVRAEDLVKKTDEIIRHNKVMESQGERGLSIREELADYSRSMTEARINEIATKGQFTPADAAKLLAENAAERAKLELYSEEDVSADRKQAAIDVLNASDAVIKSAIKGTSVKGSQTSANGAMNPDAYSEVQQTLNANPNLKNNFNAFAALAKKHHPDWHSAAVYNAWKQATGR